MISYSVNPEWRTATVVELCQSMREAQDFSALPILADAVQDAGCPEGSELLARLRSGACDYVESVTLTARLWSGSGDDAVNRLIDFTDKADCPEYKVVMNAATGNHHLNGDPESGEVGYYCSENHGEHIYFGGRDAHDRIPDWFWDAVETVTGKRVASGDRAKSFSCSC